MLTRLLQPHPTWCLQDTKSSHPSWCSRNAASQEIKLPQSPISGWLHAAFPCLAGQVERCKHQVLGARKAPSKTWEVVLCFEGLIWSLGSPLSHLCWAVSALTGWAEVLGCPPPRSLLRSLTPPISLLHPPLPTSLWERQFPSGCQNSSRTVAR